MRNRVVGRVLTGVATVGLFVGLMPATAQAVPSVTLVSAKASALVGEPLTAYGKVATTGVNNTAVEAWTGSKWATSQSGLTKANGEFSLRLTYGSVTVGGTKFRLRVTVSGQALYSREFTITRKTTDPVVLSAPSSAYVGSAVTVSAKVSNLGSGRRVWTQFLVGGTWRSSQVAVTNSTGTVKLSLSYGQGTAGKYTWRLVSTNPYGVTSASKTFVLQRTVRPAAPVRIFVNCAALTQVYPHGVGRAGAVNRNAKGQIVTQVPFTVNTAVYNANIGRDGDKDGIACER